MRGAVVTALSRLSAAASIVVIIGLLPWLSGQRVEYTILRARYTELEPSAAALDEIRRELGLDRAPVTILWEWLTGLFSGNFGTSWVSHESLFQPTLAAFSVSLSLMSLSLFSGVVIGLLLAVPVIYRGVRGIRRRPNSALAITLVSIPSFVLAAGGILLFVVWLRWLPPYGWNNFSSTVLPALSLGIPTGGLIGQLLSDSLSSAFAEPWVNTWRMAAFSRWQIAVAVLRRTLPTLLPQIGLVVIGLTGGAVVVEYIFAIPGIGTAALSAANSQDIPALQASVVMLLLLALAVGVLMNFAARFSVGRAKKNLQLAPPAPVPGASYKVLAIVCSVLLVGVIGWGLSRDPLISAHKKLAPPSWEIPLGADASGRDLLARIGHGGLMTMGSAVLIMLAVLLLSLLLSAFTNCITGISEVINALPAVIVGLVAVALFGPSTMSAITAVTLITLSPLAAYTAALVKEARLGPAIRILPTMGVGRVRTFFLHILPAVAGPAARYAVLWLPGVALSLTLLSFLGLGPQPPTPDWGLILTEGIPYAEQAPLLVLAPWMVLVLASLLAAAAAGIYRKA